MRLWQSSTFRAAGGCSSVAANLLLVFHLLLVFRLWSIRLGRSPRRCRLTASAAYGYYVPTGPLVPVYGRNRGLYAYGRYQNNSCYQ